MQRQRRRSDPILPGRPSSSLSIIKNAFSRVDCLECGICCDEKPSHITFIPNKDPNWQRLVRAAEKKHSERAAYSPSEGLYLFGENNCVFQDAKDDERRCSVYSFRPMVCTMYPFMMLGMKTLSDEGKVVEHPYVVVTSNCPPLKKVRDSGVYFLFESDFEEARLLKRAYAIIRGYIDAGLAISENNLLEIGGSLLFPVY